MRIGNVRRLLREVAADDAVRAKARAVFDAVLSAKSDTDVEKAFSEAEADARHEWGPAADAPDDAHVEFVTTCPRCGAPPVAPLQDRSEDPK